MTDSGLIERAAGLLRSGRREEAAALARQAMSAADPRVLVRAGEILGNAGAVAEARRCFQAALDRDAGLPGARFNLALTFLATGEAETAVGLLRELVAARPNLAPAWLHLGGALNAAGRYAEAASALERQLALAGPNVDGLTWLGASYQHQGRFEEAERAYRAAVEAGPGAADAHANLGKLLQAQGRAAEAEPHLRVALAADPAHPQALSGLAAWLDNDGRGEEALALLDEAGEAGGGHEAAPIRARILRRLGRPEEALALVERALAGAGLPAEASVQLRYSLGHALEALGRYDEALDAFHDANRVKRAGLPPGEPASGLAAMAAAVDELRRAFDAEAMASLPRSGCASEQPLFIVGMPRSGKSLVEQALCAHPRVRGAGELVEIGAASERLGGATGGWPGGVARVTREMLAREADRYLAVLRSAGPDAARVTDTMPFNFLHLGLIELLFPAARVVHCLREPRDLALRCYFKNFAGRTLAFACSLEGIARYHGLYRSAMDHWRRVSGLSIHEVRYEDLVARPEKALRELLEFAGLPWDAACLDFHGSGRRSLPAATQEPLHDREVGAWRRYEAELGDWLVRLAEPGS